MENGLKSINSMIILSRDVTKEECAWLEKDYKKGEVIYKYHGHTYGCIGPEGMACSKEYGEDPFFEIPLDAIDHVGSNA